MTKTFPFLLLSVPVLALACGAASAQTAAAPRTTTTHETRETARRPPRPADNRPTGPFDNQLKKFSAPLSANGAK